jgi:two-component system KDP operon response regulator KdpE
MVEIPKTSGTRGDVEPGQGLSALVLVVEDEAAMRTFVRATLVSKGYRVVEAATGGEGLTQARAHNPDVVLLDLGLPDLDGIEVTRRLREWTVVPIVVVSARGQEQDKIDALDAGADDYLTKPFGTGELSARLRAAMRRLARAGVAESALEFGDVRIDLVKRLVFRDGKELHLTPIQYKLLVELSKNAGMVVTQQQLLRNVWGPGRDHDARYVRVYMAQLRQKLEANASHPRYLVTEPGVGYRLKIDA